MSADESQYPESAETPRPWEEAGSFRRDCEPHRAGWLLGLAYASLVLTGCGLGLPLGIAAWTLARRDLVKMDAGVMDPAGRAKTAEARTVGCVSGILCVVLGGCALCVLGGVAYQLLLW